MKPLSLSIHNHTNIEFSSSAVYAMLTQYYDVNIGDDAQFHIYISYPDFKMLAKNYREDVNIYISDLTLQHTEHSIIPDMNIYDYGIGFYNIQFENRYLNLSNIETHKRCESVVFFLINIFEAEYPKRRAQEVVQLYYNLKEQVCECNTFLHTHNITPQSKFYTLLKITGTFLQIKAKIITFILSLFRKF